MNTKNTIVTEGLCKKYGKVMSVKDLDLQVRPGEVYGFLGPNGAGKSTTLKMILGLARPTQGKIYVLGKEMNQKNRLEILKNVGSLIESPSYYGHLTGEENLRITQTLKGVSPKEIREVLHIVRLENQRNKRVGQYSLGMKQRLGIASALLGYPQLLVLDEPTNGLDPAGIQEMRELICSLPKQLGMTVIVSSHLLSEIDQLATSVGIISHGELVFQDQLTALHAQSQKSIVLRTVDDLLAQKLLTNSGIDCQLQEGYVSLPYLEDSKISWCSMLLAQHQIGVIRIEERQKSLEDIFLELTGSAVSL